MRHLSFLLALLSAPAFAQSAQLTLAPATVSVAKGQTSTEIVLTYRTGPSATAVEADVAVNLDRFGWAEAQVIPSTVPSHENFCQVVGGIVRVLVWSPGAQNLPAGATIPVCRMRVRTHAHTSRGFYQVNLLNVYESDVLGNSSPVTTNHVLVYVPY